MTNEECVEILKSKLDGYTDTSYEWCECVRMAIKALEQPSCEKCENASPCIYCKHTFEIADGG